MPEIPLWAAMIVWTFTLLIERWLARTSWTPAGSILDLIGRAFKAHKHNGSDVKQITGHFINNEYQGDDMAVLEGTEVEGKIGDVGQYSLDINEHLVLEIKAGIKIDLLAELKKLADKSSNSLVKGLYGVVNGFFGEQKAAQAEVEAPKA